MLMTILAVSVGVVLLGLLASLLYGRGVDRWGADYLRQWPRRRLPSADQPVHVLLCVCDHFEPRNGQADPATARQRVRNWVEKYPRLFAGFHDADGRTPCHTFFYPLEQYDAADLDTLAELCRHGFGEVEVHLHHDHDTAESLRRRLLAYKELLNCVHGLLPRHRETEEIAYGFIHGDWALDNFLRDGRCCGVNSELTILRETGCYADFTLPAAPNRCQTRKINSIYYATDDPRRPRSHDWGTDVGASAATGDDLMLIQGPLMLNWQCCKAGIVPRLENGCLQAGQPPSARRLDLWLKARVQVRTRPDWFFVKLHTHGAPEPNQQVLLGPPMVHFHQMLARRAHDNPRFHFHYVTAREMYNLARAAAAGWTGSVADARNHELIWNPRGGSSQKRENPEVNLAR